MTKTKPTIININKQLKLHQTTLALISFHNHYHQTINKQNHKQHIPKKRKSKLSKTNNLRLKKITKNQKKINTSIQKIN